MSVENNELHVKSVQALSTGKGSQHPEHRFGSWKPSLWWLLMSRQWIEIPILVYVIEHRDGLVLFDAGMDAAILSDPHYIASPIGRFIARKLFRLNITRDDTLANKMSDLGYDVADVRKVIISHLHFDHIGCIKEVPQADLLVSETEWRQLDTPHPERDFILREHIELPGAKWCQIEFQPTDDPVLAPFGRCHDVMGDGSVVLVPTPGHTVGSLSMLMRTRGFPPMLFVGDLTYDSELLMSNQLPGTGDKKQLLASFAKVQKLKRDLPDLLILPTHDGTVPDTLAKARV